MEKDKTSFWSAVGSLFSEVMSYKKRVPDGKLAECAPLPKRVCQEKEKSRIRRTEGDKKWFDLEPLKLSEDEEEFGWTLWKWEASCKAGQRVYAPSGKSSAVCAPKVVGMCLATTRTMSML